MGYWAETDHLGLDESGRLWLRMPADSEDPDRPLGPVGRAILPLRPEVTEKRLEYERDWLLQEWEDAPDPAELREEARSVYYRGLLR